MTKYLKALSELDDWISAHKDHFLKPNLILLFGDMGAGKTTLVAHVVESLGGEKGQVSSPTFALHHLYKTPKLDVDHMDLYRLESEQDLQSSGFFDVVSSHQNLIFIEWASRIERNFFLQLNRPVYSIEIKKGVSPEEREIDFHRLG